MKAWLELRHELFSKQHSQEEAQQDLSCGYLVPEACHVEGGRLNKRQIPTLLELLFPFHSRC